MSTGPTSAAGLANTVAGLVRGRQRWIERMRAAKARGEIAKIPGGHKPGQRGPIRSKDKIVARAQRLLDDVAMARNRSLLPASHDATAAVAEAFFEAGSLAVERVRALLALDLDLERLVDLDWLQDVENRKIAAVLLKTAALQKDAALGVIGGQIRIGEARLRRQPPGVGTYDQMLEQLGPAERPLADILAEVESK